MWIITVRMKEEMIDAVYAQQHECEIDQRELECLIALIENGIIDSWESLAEYGIDND